MLAGYRLRAGLEPKAKGYGGWDSVDGKQLTGHIGGHYLSAVSLMWAATGDARFKERADYLVQELKEVQDKHGDGYLGALDNGKERFAEVAQGNIRSGGFDLNGLWSPWYVLHKTYAGLRDAYRFTGNRTALEVEIKFAAWAEGILVQARRRPGPADAEHRVRRHERDLRRPVRRHGRQAVARICPTSSSTARSPIRSSGTRTTWPASTATPRSPR